MTTILLFFLLLPPERHPMPHSLKPVLFLSFIVSPIIAAMTGRTQGRQARIRILRIMIQMRSSKRHLVGIARSPANALRSMRDRAMFTLPASLFFAGAGKLRPVFRVAMTISHSHLPGYRRRCSGREGRVTSPG